MGASVGAVTPRPSVVRGSSSGTGARAGRVRAGATSGEPGLVPSLSRTRAVSGRRVDATATGHTSLDGRVDSFALHHGSGHGGGHHGSHFGHFGHSLFHFGIYGSHYYPYWWSGIYIGYPYVGYYGYYDYPYLNSYGCDFYSGYYIRFGRVRASYYSLCPRFGAHMNGGHHYHRYACGVHGAHYYHRRDCAECYPGGMVDDIYPELIPEGAPDLPPAAPDVEEAPGSTRPDDTTAGLSSLRATVADRSSRDAVLERRSPLSPDAKKLPADPLADLTPSQVTFAMGILAFRKGNYDEASEYFFNASIEDSGSVVPELFLAVSLVSIAEFVYAATYLRTALQTSPGLITTPVGLDRIYGDERAGELARHRNLLEERHVLHPADPDTQLLRSFLALNAGDLEAAGQSALALRDGSESNEDRELGAALLKEVERRRSDPNTTESTARSAFLENPEIGAIPGLSIR